MDLIYMDAHQKADVMFTIGTLFLLMVAGAILSKKIRYG